MNGADNTLAPDRLSGKAWLVLVAYTASLFLVQLGAARTFTGHECYVAQAAREMADGGDWLVPRIAGKPWLEKPPLPYWTVAGLTELMGGVNELVARAPSAIAGLLGVMLIASLAARWFGPMHGLLAGLIQATTVYTVTYARLAEPDIYLWLIVLGCLWIFARQQVEPPAPTRWYSSRLAFFVLLGLTQLVKGPLFGAVIALLPCVGFAVLQRRWASIKWFFYWPGIVLCVLIAVAWPAAVLWQHPEAGDLWWAHTFGRLSQDSNLNVSVDGKSKPIWYYLTTLPWQVLPWTLVMLPALPGSLKRAWHNARSPDRFLWLWLLLPLAALSLARAKHHHYLIYALPPCAFWTAEGLLRIRDWAARLLSRLAFTIPATCLLVGGLVGAAWWFHRHAPDYLADALAIGTLLFLGCALLTFACATRNFRSAAVTLFAVIWLAYGYVHFNILERTDSFREDTALLRRLNDQVPEGGRILILGLDPARLLLYLDAPAEVFEKASELEARGRELPEALVLTSLGHEEKLREVGEPHRLDQTPSPRWANLGEFSQLAVYRMAWRQRGENVISSTNQVGPSGPP